jgi:hypothetical protein
MEAEEDAAWLSSSNEPGGTATNASPPTPSHLTFADS